MPTSGRSSPTKWFLKKLAAAPAAWIGLAAGVASGFAFSGQGPTSGAIGFGTMTALAVGIMAFSVSTIIKAAHRQAVAGIAQKGLRATTLRNLEKAGLDREKSFLSAMLEDRELIVSALSSQEVTQQSSSTLDLVDSLVASAFRSADELADLARRSADPLLDSPENGETKIDAIKQELEQAFRTVADARSELRVQATHQKSDPLSAGEDSSESDLAALTGKLRKETDISGKVRKRLEPEEFSGTIVMDDLPQEGDPLESDSESS